MFAAAAVLLGAFVVIERRAVAPLVPFRIFRLRTVAGANVTMLLVGAAMFALFYFLSLYMQQVLGWSALETGLAQLPLAGTLVLAAGAMAPLVTRLGSKPVTLAGLVLFAAGLAWFSRMPADADFVADLLGPSLVVAVGLAATFVSLTVSAVDGITEDESGLASGLINTTQQIGGALGLAVLTAVASGRTESVAGDGRTGGRAQRRLPSRPPGSRRDRRRSSRRHRPLRTRLAAGLGHRGSCAEPGPRNRVLRASNDGAGGTARAPGRRCPSPGRVSGRRARCAGRSRVTRLVMTLAKDSYEAIVVGSGFGGAVATCRLAQAGVDVALIERGRRFPLGSFPRHRTRPDLQHWRRGGTYDVRHLGDVLVVQGVGYGGGSLIYANVQIRPPADVFDADWPTSYPRAALDPYYDLVGHMLDIAPVREDPATGELPPKTRLMEAAAARLGREGQTFRPNLAVRFEGAGEEPRPNKFGALQGGCTNCGECDIGCNLGAKNTLDLNYLTLAERSGAEVATGSEVTWLGAGDEGFRVRYRDLAGDGESKRWGRSRCSSAWAR